MEHRCSTRKKILLNVIIRNQRGLMQRGKARNLSNEGMYIEVTSAEIKKGIMLDIELSDTCCLRGWVAHDSDNGIGVLFSAPAFTEVEPSDLATMKIKKA